MSSPLEDSELTVELSFGEQIMVIKTPEGKIKCPLCTVVVSSVPYFKNHYTFKHTRKELLCDFCGLRNLPDQTAFVQHVQTFHSSSGEDRLKCAKCGYLAKDKLALWRHITETETSRGKKFTCGECDAAYSSSTSLKIHTYKKHLNLPLPPNKCKECDATFPERWSLRHHVASVHRENVVSKCTQCPKEFKNVARLRAHVKRLHSSTPRSHPCTLCNINFRHAEHLRRHEKSETHKLMEKGDTAEAKARIEVTKYRTKRRRITEGLPESDHDEETTYVPKRARTYKRVKKMGQIIHPKKKRPEIKTTRPESKKTTRIKPKKTRQEPKTIHPEAKKTRIKPKVTRPILETSRKRCKTKTKIEYDDRDDATSIIKIEDPFIKLEQDLENEEFDGF